MNVNELPVYDASDNPTDCCPRFNTEGWDRQDLHFKDKLFVRAKTKSLMHIPVNMGSVFKKTFEAIDAAGAQDMTQAIVLSRDLSPWAAEHYFAVTKDVPGQDMAPLSGHFRTKLFEGPYKDAPKWAEQMEAELDMRGEKAEKTYFFYTTCPKCAKVYGKNYVVGISQLAA